MRTRVPLLALLIIGLLAAAEPSAWELYEHGRAAEKAGRMAQAYLLYSEAAALDPQNQDYWLRSQAVSSRAALESKLMPTEAEMKALDPDAEPLPELEKATPRDIADAKQTLPPSELKAESGVKDFNLRENSRRLYEIVSKAYGLDCVFDGDYIDMPAFHFELSGVNYREALHGLELATGTFIVPLSDKLFLVAKDTPQKRNENQPMVALSIPVPEAMTREDLTAVLMGIQQTMTIQHLAFDSERSTVIMRDHYAKLLPAKALLEQLMHPRAQVLVELQLVEVSRNDMITYGIDFPTLFSLTPVTTWLQNQVAVPTNISGLLGFGGGKTLIGLGVMNASLVAHMSQGNGKVLLNMQLRGMGGQAASIHIGDRYPVLTSGYFGPADYYQQGGQTAYTPIPSFTFEDLGLSLKVTPAIHDMDEVTLNVEADFKLLTGQSVNGIPVISNRSLKSVARLQMGQWAAVAGLLNTSEARTIAGLAGLSSLPYLGPLFSKHTNNDSRNEILIMLRPHLLTQPPNQYPVTPLLVGSDTKPITPL